MTKFDKFYFEYSGGFLNYHGTFKGQQTYGEVYGADKCHPSRVDQPKPEFIARFKYRGPFTKAVFVKELMKNHTVEGYLAALRSGKAPLEVLREKNPSWYETTIDKFVAKSQKTA